MQVKSNIPLSDNELRMMQKIFRSELCKSDILLALQLMFPDMRIDLAYGILYVGNPPWDLTQELQIPENRRC